MFFIFLFVQVIQVADPSQVSCRVNRIKKIIKKKAEMYELSNNCYSTFDTADYVFMLAWCKIQ